MTPSARLLAFVFALLALPASAQTTVYGNVTLSEYGYRVSTAGTYRLNGDVVGVGGGVTWLIPSASRLRAGIDARASASPGIRGGSDATAALRIQLVPHRVPLRPYFQIGGGFVHVDTTYGFETQTTTTTTSTVIAQGHTAGALHIGLGLEVPVSDHWAVRAIELDSTSGPHVGAAHLGASVLYTLGGR